MALHYCHTPETLEYVEAYLWTIYSRKNLVPEFRTTKAIHKQAERQQLELKEQIANADRNVGAGGSAIN